MDTIIYLHRRAENEPASSGERDIPYEITIFPIQDYRLIRVEIQNVFWEELVSEKTAPAEDMSLRRILPWVRGRERRHRKCRARLAEDFRHELAALLDERDDNYCVTGNGTEIEKRRKILPLPEFDGYLDQKWVQRLLPHAVHPHFIVLGTVSYLPTILAGLSPRMKSLTWILPEEERRGSAEDFAEEFYQEYGLAVNLYFEGAGKPVAYDQPGSRRRKDAVSILDFTREGRIPIIEAAADSVWLDMASLAEKERHMDAKQVKTAYISLKKLWRHPQKQLSLLDTTRKNRYNT